jgi:endonuclease/exonuclease/phosphatase family metal-dependent hydrolase
MKRLSILSIVFIFMNTAVSQAQSSAPLTVMSYNIRLDVASDSGNAWGKRKELLAGLIRFHAPAIVGMQEAQRHQLDYLSQVLPEYAWIGVGRDDGKDAGEFMAILYRKELLEPVRSSTFWCSQNPSGPGLGWDAACNRVVTWGKFQRRTDKKEFFFFNTHLDHLGVTARRESARLLIDSINAITGRLPVVITGDFNSGPKDEPYQTIIGDRSKKKFRDTSVLSQRPHYGPSGTFNGFKLMEYSTDPIDYIFVSDGIDVLSHGTLTDSFYGRIPSDHFPVITSIRLDAKH